MSSEEVVATMMGDSMVDEFNQAGRASRSTATGTRGGVSSGHPYASLAGLDMLRRGGNAVDAGVAAGICLNVVHHDMTTFSGVAPIILYSSREQRVVTISGLGRWPKRASLNYFWNEQGGRLTPGIAHCMVPSAVDAWARALELYGSMSLSEVMAPAIEYARTGFPVHAFMAYNFRRNWEAISRWPSSKAAVVAPSGEFPTTGDVLVQSDLANTLESIVDEECAASGNREDKIRKARDRFYKGDIARKFLDFSDDLGGFFTAEDFEEFSVREEPPATIDYKGHEVFVCGPWCQGPVLAQTLNILKHFNVQEMGHNSSEYVHTVLEALNLAFADRESYYGDPDFVEVPMKALLSESYGARRAELIRNQQAWGRLAPPGDPENNRAQLNEDEYRWPPSGDWEDNCRGEHASLPEEPDTSYVCAVDNAGNMFSATPSDSFTSHLSPPIVPGLGLPFSGRGVQSRLEPDHPAALAPQKRPRLTPSPALILKGGKPWMAIGSPGRDMQPQAMVQVLLNILEFGMDPQLAVEMPRFGSYSFPGSSYPYEYKPGLVRVEDRIKEEVAEELKGLGHKVERWPPRTWRAGSVCVAGPPLPNAVWQIAADNRREAAAIAW